MSLSQLRAAHMRNVHKRGISAPSVWKTPMTRSRAAVVVIGLILFPGVTVAAERCDEEQTLRAGCQGSENCSVIDGSSVDDPELKDFLNAFPTIRCSLQLADGIEARNCLSQPQRRDGSTGHPGSLCEIWWEGAISRTRVRKMVALLDSLPALNSPVSTRGFYVTSDGGDVYAALELGRRLREVNAAVYVIDRCASACVFLLAAGILRMPFQGDVVIHRPYSLDRSVKSYEKAQETYRQINDAIAQFLREMNVPLSLLDAMLNVAPHRGQMLTRSDLRKYGLDQPDPAFEQLRNSVRARRRGLSMLEYLQRKRAFEACEERAGWDWDRREACYSIWD